MSSSNSERSSSHAVVVGPDQGRTYDMGRMKAVFFVDGDEADGKYSISEWSLEARTRGPGAHSHPEDHIYRVVCGTLSVIVEGERRDLASGGYAVIPGGVSHDFENHAAEPCTFVSINSPAGFEQMLPSLVTWFADKPLEAIDDG